MIKRFNNYILNSMKVAILGFCWFMLSLVPWESLPKAPLGGGTVAVSLSLNEEVHRLERKLKNQTKSCFARDIQDGARKRPNSLA